MEKDTCPIDIWVLPRGSSVTTYRYALDRLFSQAFRRCQATVAFNNVQVDGYRPDYRTFFSGEPMFRFQGVAELRTLDTYGYSRAVDPIYGAFYWQRHGQDVVDDNDNKVWDTAPIWNNRIGQ